jgi:hypothetical protein
MQRRGMERFAPLAGVVFLVLIVISFVITGEPPDADEGAAETASYWSDNDDVNVISAALSALAAVALVWFGASLRAVIAEAEGRTARLATLAFAGFVIAAAGAGVNSSLQFAAADTVGEVPAEVTQTISALYAYLWFPFTIGFALTMFATGVAALRFGVLPAWLAWASILIGVVLLTPAGFVGFLLSLIWVAALAVMLYLRGDGPAADEGAVVTPG